MHCVFVNINIMVQKQTTAKIFPNAMLVKRRKLATNEIMIAPVLNEIAQERVISISKVNTDSNPVSPGRFGVRGIPALLLFNNGEMIDRMTGAMPKQNMDAWLDKYMS